MSSKITKRKLRKENEENVTDEGTEEEFGGESKVESRSGEENKFNEEKSRENKSKEEKVGTKSKILENKSKVKEDKGKLKECEVPPPKYGPLPRISKERIISRGIIILGVIVYVWYSTKEGKEIVLASHKDILQKRGQTFQCDADYYEEIANFDGCLPNQCGRYVFDKLVTLTEAETLLKVAIKGISLGGSDGGASILDLHSGALSYGKKFINLYSLPESKRVLMPADLAIYKIVKEKIKRQIAHTFHLDPESLYLTHPTFFSRLTNLEPKTEHDEYWHAHVDKETYESFHYTSLLYLSDYGIDFTGGRLIWIDGPLEKPKANVTLEPRKGRVAIFTSGAENIHFVERVKSGTRYAITVSFTCDINKAITDPVERSKLQ